MSNVKSYFKKVGKNTLFIGETLDIFVPMRYQVHGCLTEKAGTIEVLAVFDMLIDGKHEHGQLLPSVITIHPHSTEQITRDEQPYMKINLIKNSIFMEGEIVVVEDMNAYVLFYELTYNAKIPKFLNYDLAPFVFDRVAIVNDFPLPTRHVIFELLVAHLHRSPKDINTLYRMNPKGEPTVIPLRAVSYAALTSIGKYMGSFAGDGLAAALVNPSDVDSDLEDILTT